MKLYKYHFDSNRVSVNFEELEVEEKGDKFIVITPGWQKIIHKSDVEEINSFPQEIVIIREADFEKARTIYLARLQREFLIKQRQLEEMKLYYDKVCDMEAIV